MHGYHNLIPRISECHKIAAMSHNISMTTLRDNHVFQNKKNPARIPEEEHGRCSENVCALELPFHIVYCSENPRALKNKSKAGLPVIWKLNRKAWVTASLFEDWFGHHFIPEGKCYCQSKQIPFKVMLIIDNAPGHPPATLTNFDPRVKVVFLPPNTTSLLQPMDQGVTKTFKAYYTRRSFAHLHEAMRQNNELFVKDFWKQFNVLDAERIIGQSWNEVSQKTLNEAESVPEPDEIGNVIEEVVDLARQINLEVDSDDLQELLDSHNQELTIDELIEMREQEQDIEEPDSLDPVQSEDRMMVGNLTDGLSSIEKGLQILENIDANEECISSTK
ncbi:tigger transposable element-derived protein 1-like [Centruroides sculpturatus]|uniref:tigger transposable element-derived protein 1-like n=1 Tax=Centruroides sculpturatus TaxID=218467 RepID=UPI000C6E00B6|nr:tigger transposable element-derived protein 1-like [Centruroides sculpturatus]